MKPKVIWFTGLPCSGKTTLAEMLPPLLRFGGQKVVHLDGDVIREMMGNPNFQPADRDVHIRYIGLTAALLQKTGCWVIASFISPYEDSRNFVRELCEDFLEIYLSTPRIYCEKRDVKGMYEKAVRGEISNFTGVSAPYEPPKNPDIILDTSKMTVFSCLRIILKEIAEESLGDKNESQS